MSPAAGAVSFPTTRRRVGSLFRVWQPVSATFLCGLLSAPYPGGRGTLTEGRLVNNDQVPNYEMSGGKRRNRPPADAWARNARPRRDPPERVARRELETEWAEIALPACLVLIVSIPVMIVEEDWHGRPMIDEGTHLWILPVLLVASAFLFGGALAGFRDPSAALAHDVPAASFALLALLLGAVLRRFWVVHEGVPIAVVYLWCLGIIVALMLSLIGSLLGRRWQPTGIDDPLSLDPSTCVEELGSTLDPKGMSPTRLGVWARVHLPHRSGVVPLNECHPSGSLSGSSERRPGVLGHPAVEPSSSPWAGLLRRAGLLRDQRL